MVIIFLLLFLSIKSQSVCGYDGQEYSSPVDAHSHHVGVMHCGNCGKCSNSHDIRIYASMATVLTRKTTLCAIGSIFGFGRACMRKYVGFTQSCLDCWMENIKCTRRKCTSVCIIPSFLNRQSVSNGTTLNKCLRCDEDNCGPQFLKCAGANRRRCGIETDITRPDTQICKVVDLPSNHWKNIL